MPLKIADAAPPPPAVFVLLVFPPPPTLTLKLINEDGIRIKDTVILPPTPPRPPPVDTLPLPPPPPMIESETTHPDVVMDGGQPYATLPARVCAPPVSGTYPTKLRTALPNAVALTIPEGDALTETTVSVGEAVVDRVTGAVMSVGVAGGVGECDIEAQVDAVGERDCEVEIELRRDETGGCDNVRETDVQPLALPDIEGDRETVVQALLLGERRDVAEMELQGDGSAKADGECEDEGEQAGDKEGGAVGREHVGVGVVDGEKSPVITVLDGEREREDAPDREGEIVAEHVANGATMATETAPSVSGAPGPVPPGMEPAPEEERRGDAHDEPPPPPVPPKLPAAPP